MIQTSTALFRGQSVNVRGTPLAVGDTLPDAALVSPDLHLVNLSVYHGKVRLISVIPGLDSGICDVQTQRFNEAAERWQDRVTVITISVDLPFTQKRWQKDANAKHLVFLSDHRTMAFGNAIGTHVESYRMERRCILVVDRDERVTYVEYVPEIAQHPDYDAAIAAADKLL